MLPLMTLAAPLPELLEPVDGISIARLQDRSNFGLRGQLYSAKRSRIVLINFDVLEQERLKDKRSHGQAVTASENCLSPFCLHASQLSFFRSSCRCPSVASPA